jgi:hypothetical protein
MQSCRLIFVAKALPGCAMMQGIDPIEDVVSGPFFRVLLLLLPASGTHEP